MCDCCEAVPEDCKQFTSEPVTDIEKVTFYGAPGKLSMNLAYFCANFLAPNTLCKLWRKVAADQGGGYAMVIPDSFMSWEVPRPGYPVHKFADCNFLFVVDILDDHDKEAVNCVIDWPDEFRSDSDNIKY